MKVLMTRKAIILQPETAADEIYLESVVGADGAGTKVERHGANHEKATWGWLVVARTPDTGGEAPSS